MTKCLLTDGVMSSECKLTAYEPQGVLRFYLETCKDDDFVEAFF